MIKKILKKIRLRRLKKDIYNDRDFIGLSLIKTKNLFLKQEELEIGDILFFTKSRERKGLISSCIESFTAGYYVHCAIYVGNGEVIEALRDGVKRAKLEVRIKDCSYLPVVRMRTDMKSKIKMANTAKQYLGYKYNILGAMFATWNENKHVLAAHSQIGKMASESRKIKKPRKLFCSQLIMECIRESGVLYDIELKADFFQSQNCTPTGLAKYGYPDMFNFIGYIVHNNKLFNERDYFLSNTMDPEYHYSR